MKRLFIVISLGIFLALLISSLTASQIMRYTVGKKFEREAGGWFRQHILVVQQHLRNVPQEDLEQELAHVQKFIKDPIRMVPMNDPSVPPDVWPEFENSEIVTRRTPQGPFTYVALEQKNGILVVGPHRRPQPFRWFHLIVVLGVTIPIVGITGLILTVPVVRRLRKLENATVQIRKGNLSARADVPSSDAVGQVAQQFNQMADRIQNLLESQQHLLQAVSHELRTPISRIGFILEMLLSTSDSVEKEKRVGEIQEELTELNHLVSELLLFTRFDSKSLELETQEIELPETLKELTDRNQNVRPDIKVTLLSDTGNARTANVHPVYFRRAIQNLIYNAIRHARSEVAIHYGKTESVLFLVVSDDGPGIPLEYREKIFQPFFRIDESRSRQSGGAGLGLAIVRRIVEIHKGTVTVTDGEKDGARFITTWPIGG